MTTRPAVPPSPSAPAHHLLRRLRVLFLTCSLAASLASDAVAGLARFTPTGPDGGTVTTLVFDPADSSILYAGTRSAGLFRSLNGGASWHPIGLSGPWVTALTVSSSSPEMLYAAVSGVGIFRSENRAARWQRVEGEGRTFAALGIAVHPRFPDAVIAANGERVISSQDGGATWIDVTPQETLNFFRIPLFDPERPERLYLGSNGGIYRSTDGGASWARFEPRAFVLALALDPNDPQRLYAGVDRGVLQTTDGGDTWTLQPLSDDTLTNVTALAVSPSDPRTLYAANSGSASTVFVSRDAGANWTPAGTFPLVHALAVHPESPETALMATRRLGVLRTTDGGSTWTPSRRGLAASEVRAVEIDPFEPRTLVVAVADGPAAIARSEDGGVTWMGVEVGTGSGLGFQPGESLVADPRTPGRLFGIVGGSLVASEDFGRTWVPVEAVPFQVHAVTPVTEQPDSLLAAASEAVPCNLGLGCPQLTARHLYRTIDGGVHWIEALEPRTISSPLAFATSPSEADFVYFADGRLFASDDGGLTWRDHDQPLPLFDLAVDPADPRSLFAATSLRRGGVLRSADGGETFQPVAPFPLPDERPRNAAARALLFAPGDSAELLAGSDAGVFRSLDRGGSWEDLSSGLGSRPVTGLARDRRSPEILYATSPEGGGLFARTDGSAGCTPGATTLCLSGGRFRVEVAWEDFGGRRGAGRSLPITDDTGGFWFFSPDNVELVVKVLDGRPVNGHHWVFYASLSNVAFDITVIDSASGDLRIFSNPPGRFASRGVADAFPAREPARAGLLSSPTSRPRMKRAATSVGACTPDATRLCLRDDRFEIEVTWEDTHGNRGRGHARPLFDQPSADSGAFWFFAPENLELAIKVLDGTSINGHFWVYLGSLTDVAFELTVTDRRSGASRKYRNPAGTFASVADLQAF